MKYDEILELSMDIIANSGESKSLAMESIKLAKEAKFEESEEKLKSSKTFFNLAHKKQMELISYETKNKVDIFLILVHAQDHLTMANLSCYFAKELLDLYKKIETK